MKKVFSTKCISIQNDNGEQIHDLILPKNKITLSNFMEQVTEDNSKFGIVYVKVDNEKSKEVNTVCISYVGGKVSFNNDKLEILKNGIVENDGYMNEAYGSTDYFIKVKK